MEGKSAEEVIDFMDKNERTLSQNPFERKAVKVEQSGNDEIPEKDDVEPAAKPDENSGENGEQEK